MDWPHWPDCGNLFCGLKQLVVNAWDTSETKKYHFQTFIHPDKLETEGYELHRKHSLQRMLIMASRARPENLGIHLFGPGIDRFDLKTKDSFCEQ